MPPEWSASMASHLTQVIENISMQSPAPTNHAVSPAQEHGQKAKGDGKSGISSCMHASSYSLQAGAVHTFVTLAQRTEYFSLFPGPAWPAIFTP